MSSTGTKKVAIYGRVSVDENEGRSVDSQITECQAWATRENWQVIATERDDGISASRYAAKGAVRDGWQAVMDLIGRGAVDALLVWESSRASRDRAEYAALLAACQARHVLLGVGGRLHDPNDADDGFMLDLNSALAVRESAMTSKRIVRGKRTQAAKGAPQGRIPFGYRREYDADSGELIGQYPDPDTAPVFREIAHRVLAGESLYALARELNDRGVTTRTGAKWTPIQIRRTLLSPTYAGKRIYQGRVLDGVTADWEPLIDEGTHHRIVAKLTDPKRATRRDGKVKHLLSNIAECGVCGGPLYWRKNRNTPSYVCVPGFCVARAKWLVDDVVTRAVIARLEQPDALDLFTPAGHDVDAARAEAAELRARLDGFYDQAADGQLTPAALSRIEGKLLPQIADADRRCTPELPTPLAAELVGDQVRERWEQLTMPQRREVVRALLTPVVHKQQQGKRADYDSIEIRWHRGEQVAPTASSG